MTLYLKYRPQTLEELDLARVRESLKKIVSSGKIPHALIFSGPKGSGKTSAARILAKVVNCENPSKDGAPCNKCNQCTTISKGENLDVIELDAASHRGIDDVRALREAVKLATTKAKKKVYIIDEAHMLTTEASNALLKTLEEPPPHVIFILATTNPEKLIETIRSRTTQVLFRKATDEEIVRSLTRVVAGEKIKASKEVLKIIAKHSGGSFRDAVKTLEQITSEGKELTEAEVEEFLFGKKSFNPESFLEVLVKKDVKKALEDIERAVSLGISAKNLTTLIIARLRSALLAKIGVGGESLESFSKDELIRLIKLLSKASSEVASSVFEQIPLELAVLEWCQVKTKSTTLVKQSQKPVRSKKESKARIEDKQGKLDSKKNSKSVSFQNSAKKFTNGLTDEVWVSVLSQIRPKNASTEALLRASRPIEFDGKVLTLGVYYRFHKERLEGNPHRDILEQALGIVLGSSVRVVCTLTEPPVKAVEPEVVLTEPDSVFRPEGVLTESDSVLTEGQDKDIIKVAKEIFGQQSK